MAKELQKFYCQMTEDKYNRLFHVQRMQMRSSPSILLQKFHLLGLAIKMQVHVLPKHTLNIGHAK